MHSDCSFPYPHFFQCSPPTPLWQPLTARLITKNIILTLEAEVRRRWRSCLWSYCLETDRSQIELSSSPVQPFLTQPYPPVSDLRVIALLFSPSFLPGHWDSIPSCASRWRVQHRWAGAWCTRLWFRWNHPLVSTLKEQITGERAAGVLFCLSNNRCSSCYQGVRFLIR